MTSAEQLNQAFAIDGVVAIKEQTENYPVIEVTNPHASASIALHGAHIMRYQNPGQTPLLWLSKTAIYKEGKAIRGGIPICWPWFGNQKPREELSAHGFVRNRFWQLKSVTQENDKSTRISLQTQEDEHTLTLWPHHFTLELVVIVGPQLSVELNMTNTGDAPFSCTSALHSYFEVGHISDVGIQGYDQCKYIDTLADNSLLIQEEEITFDQEVDRIYVDTDCDAVIADRKLQRKIRVGKSGSVTSVIWNPWIKKSAGMSDFEEGGYQNMLCIEAANAYDDVIEVSPGNTHTLGTVISQESLES